jgi:hypothetical protein
MVRSIADQKDDRIVKQSPTGNPCETLEEAPLQRDLFITPFTTTQDLGANASPTRFPQNPLASKGDEEGKTPLRGESDIAIHDPQPIPRI